jgi:hypothetical protein
VADLGKAQAEEADGWRGRTPAAKKLGAKETADPGVHTVRQFACYCAFSGNMNKPTLQKGSLVQRQVEPF